MADFRKSLYALAVVALLAGLTVPASAQVAPLACQVSQSNVPIVRAEGYTELVGDIVLVCTGGQPTAFGQPVPQVNFTVFLNTNITSRILESTTKTFNEALLIIDEPNTNLRTPPSPILNCGNTGALDNGPASGPGVCSITSFGQPRDTYNGVGSIGVDVTTQTTGTCGTTVPGSNPARTFQPTSQGGYGCGRPNVFQGRLGVAQNTNQFNAVSFLGVPFDAPGTNLIRTIRITNVRADATRLGVSSTFTTNQIQANIAVNGSTPVTINNPTQIVAYVNKGLLPLEVPSTGTVGLIGGVRTRQRFDFVQCVAENPDLYLGTPAPNFIVPKYGETQGANFIRTTSGSASTVNLTPIVRFIEGFASSWKTKNIAFHSGNFNATGNATYDGFTYSYNGNRSYPSDLSQNVPGFVYNTESGFEFDAETGNNDTTVQSVPVPNPPPGYGFQTVTGPPANAALNSVGINNISLDTQIDDAGVANSGTRLVANFTNIPSGAKVFVPPIIYLFRQNSLYVTNNPNGPDPTVRDGGLGGTPVAAGNTGVMVLTSTDSAGAGNFSRRAGIGSGGNSNGSSALTPEEQRLQEVTGNLAVYEILYTDPFSLEVADVPTVVAYQSNVTQNLPTPGLTTSVTGGFAPFYTTLAASQPTPNVSASSPTHIPRFLPGTGPKDLFLINKCACNLLFPYVVSQQGWDTGIALANTSQDPGGTFGFSGIPQPGNVTFWYYGTMANGNPAPGFHTTSKPVQPGTVMLWTGANGSADYGLDNRASGFLGYVITQAQFQYCHAFAYISALGAGPTTTGTSEGYLAIVLDAASLNRTNQVGENKAH